MGRKRSQRLLVFSRRTRSAKVCHLHRESRWHMASNLLSTPKTNCSQSSPSSDPSCTAAGQDNAPLCTTDRIKANIKPDPTTLLHFLSHIHLHKEWEGTGSLLLKNQLVIKGSERSDDHMLIENMTYSEPSLFTELDKAVKIYSVYFQDATALISFLQSMQYRDHWIRWSRHQAVCTQTKASSLFCF